jgi:hypothetical protein
MSFEKNLGKALNIFEDDNQEILPPEKTQENPILEDDYEYARQNLRELIDSSTGEIHTLLDIARKSESPRAYEVVANLIRTLAETNKDLMRIAKEHKEIKDVSGNSKKPEVTNNNLFVGSTKELQDFIAEQKKSDGK